MRQPVTTISLETSQRMKSAGPSAGKGGGFICHFGPSAAETLVSPQEGRNGPIKQTEVEITSSLSQGKRAMLLGQGGHHFHP